jgi:hypothetical protein
MDKKTKDAGEHGTVPSSKAAVIAAVQTPLGFFVLVVLLVEVVLGSVAALTAGIDRTYLILGMLALVLLLVIVVAAIAVYLLWLALIAPSARNRAPVQAHNH